LPRPGVIGKDGEGTTLINGQPFASVDETERRGALVNTTRYAADRHPMVRYG
jgi:hypothetical protein